MSSIDILCPSRGRPERFKAMAESALSLAADRHSITIYLALDRDDKELWNYPPVETPWLVRSISETRAPVGHLLNSLSIMAEGDIVMACADDVLFRTPRWDARVREEFEKFSDRIAMVVPMDGAEQKKGLRTTHFFLSREWLQEVGYLACGRYEHFFDDTHAEDIARRAGRLVWLRDVLVEHMHPNHGKAQRDSTYQDKRKGEKGERASNRDESLFYELASEREEVAQRIRMRINGHGSAS